MRRGASPSSSNGAAVSETLPLFPLSTVLFPGGRLDLRIFEPRYLDLVRDCTRTGTGFGVCLISEGREAGQPARPMSVGTVARITDFSTLEDGLLGIVAYGERVFDLDSLSVRENGLVVGEVRYREADPVMPVPPEYSVLATILERIAEQVGGELDQAGKARFDDAAWVAYRLAEILPIEQHERFSLLDERNPVERLQSLARWLPRFQKG